MATTTTNYGFDVPTSSDLVKNGATQIALLGQDLDTFLFRPFTRNVVLNSGLNVWQRGTSISLAASAGTTYLADRYCTQTGANQACTVSRQATGDTTNLPFIQYALRYQRNSGQTGTGALSLMQPIETVNSVPFAGKTVTMTFYARAGANYTAASNALAFYLRTGTGTDQNPFAGYTGDALTINTTATLTTTWQRFTASATVPSTTTEMTTQFSYTPVGTASTNDYFEVTGVQLEVGSQNTPYTPCTPTYATELAACQRYYFRSTPASSFGWLGSGVAQSTTVTSMAVTLPATMRIVPTSVDFSTLALVDGVSSTAVTTCTIDSNVTSNNFGVVTASVALGLIQFRPYYLRQNSSAAGFIGFSAEL